MNYKSTKTYRTGDMKIDPVFAEIARDINELIRAVNPPQASVGYGATGKSGDLRLTIDDGKAYLEAKGDGGWLTTFQDVMVNKPARGRPFPHFEYLEVDNLFAHQFTIRQLNAVNGDTIFSDTGTVESVTTTTVTFKTQDNYNLCSFAVNDLIATRRIKSDNSADISYVKATVTAVSGRTVTVTYTSTDKFKSGDVVARVGNTTDATRKDSVYIATNPTNTPYLAIYDNINSFDTSGSPTTAWTTATPKVLVGNLKSINAGYAHGIYIAAGGEFRIAPTATVDGVVTHAPEYTSGATFPVSPVATDWHFYTKDPPDAPYIKNTWYKYSGSAWENQGLLGTYINGTGIYTGTVVATQVIAGILTGFTIQTAASGKRVVIDPSNIITFWNAFVQSATIGGGGTGFPLEILANGKMVIQTSAGATDHLYLTAGGSVFLNGTVGISGNAGTSGVSFYNDVASFGLVGTTGNINLIGDGSITLTTDNASISGGTLTLGVASTTSGQIILKNSTNALTATIWAPSIATSSKTIDLPNDTGTMALQEWVDSNYVTFPGFGTTGTTACVGNDARLSDARTPTSHGNANHSATYIVAADAGVNSFRASGVYVATSSGGSPTTQLYMVTDAISGFNFLVY